MRKLCSFIVMLLMSFTALMAQITVSGVVLSAEDNEPVIGAAVMVKGTSTGISTDIDGKFTLNNVPKNAILVISYVGMQTQEVAASKAKTIILSADDQVLDEVMVVAYGTAKKSSFTGSASVVNSKQMEKRVISNAMNALEGNTSGVQVTSASGQPGSGASIRVRGFGSVNASSAPLYVVDGAVYDGNISDINPADIESMTILKDAASTSLYGSSAGNGVVLITTKAGKGNNGSHGISLNIQQGWSNRAYKDYATLGLDDYMTITWEKVKNMRIGLGDDAATAAQYATNNLMTLLAGKGQEERYNPYKGVAANQIVDTNGKLNRGLGLKYADDLDWDNEAYGTGYRQEYTLSYSTKTDKSDTYASVGYLSEDGYMVNTDFERFSGRLNYNIQPLKWLKTGLNLGFTRTESTYSSATSDNSSAYSNISYFTRIIAPYWPIHSHDKDGAYLNADGGTTTNSSEYVYDYGGRLVGTYVGRDGLVEQLWNNRAYNRMAETGKTYLTITPIEGLNITANYSINNLDYRSKRYENPYVGDGTAGPARLAIASYRNMSQTFNQIIQYNKMIGKNNIDVMVGHESYQYKYEYFYSMKTGETIHGVNDFQNFVNISSITSYTDEYKKEGWFARANYDWDNKYYGSFSYRHDGSSRFSKDNRWGNFWSAGLSWRLTQEEWMKDIDWIDNLKIRASYGETGNDQTSSYYPYQTLYGLGYTNGTEAGAYFTDIANPNLKWETQVSTDFGVEFSLFRKLNGSIEYFKKDSKDLLFDVAQPYSQGISSIVQNIGKVSNSGVEINLDWNVYSNRDWKVNIGANATFIKNELKKLPEDMKLGYVSGSKKWLEGKSIYEFWLYQWQGVDPQTGSGYYLINEETDPETGNYTGKQVSVPAANLIEVDGKKYTNSYTYAKKDYSGASIPKMYGGFNFNVSWKDISLAAVFSYQLGGKVLDTTYADLMNNSTGYGNAMAADLLNSWMKPGDKSDIPMLSADATYNSNMNQSYSTRWLTSSNYLNLRSINLSYELPKSLLNKVQIKSARISAACENVFMIKARQGLNPMANFTGMTYNEYMPSRNFTLGLNVSF